MDAAVDAFGYTRLCYEGNWFFDNYGVEVNPSHYVEWAGVLQAILGEKGATASDMRKVLRDNAIRIYRIDSPPRAGDGSVH